MYKLILISILVSIATAQTTSAKAFFDPFKKRIEKEPIRKIKPKLPKRLPQRKKVIIPPLNIKVIGFSRGSSQLSIIVLYKGSTHLLYEGDTVKNEFRVQRISEDVVTFLNLKSSKREFVEYGISRS